MDETRLAVYGVAGFVLVVTLVSGPIVGAVDFTQEPQACSAPVGTGTATVSVDSLPDSATISRGEFGSGVYYLQVPDGSAAIRNVTGQPTLSYTISIPELGRTAGPVLFLCADQSIRQPLSIERRTIEADDLTADTYEATLTLLLRGDEETLVREKSITVEVQR
jgi:hypothetical protein